MKQYQKENSFAVNLKQRRLQPANSVKFFSGALKRFTVVEEVHRWDTPGSVEEQHCNAYA